MTPKKHHALDYARGIARIKQAISACKLAITPKGSYFSTRFKKDFKPVSNIRTHISYKCTIGNETFDVKAGDVVNFYTDKAGVPRLTSIQRI